MDELISRQAAIDALGEEPPVWYDGEDEIAEQNQWKRDIEAIKQLPPIQPEIVRCKDCQRYEYGICKKAGLCVNKSPNGFCDWGERREVTT